MAARIVVATRIAARAPAGGGAVNTLPSPIGWERVAAGRVRVRFLERELAWNPIQNLKLQTPKSKI